MPQCPFLFEGCQSPRKKKGHWACSEKYEGIERAKMCVEYTRLLNNAKDSSRGLNTPVREIRL
jgi:hypothetical protein